MAESYPSFTSNSDRGTPDWRMIDSTTHLDKPVTSQDGTSLLPGEYAELTQPTPQGV